MKNIASLTFILLIVLSSASGQEISIKDITVLKEPADTMMKSYLTHLVDQQFSRRDSLLALLKSASAWDSRAQTIRDSMVSWTGPFPARTSLNARTTGVIDRKDYVIEKIIFESRADFLVSGNLYIPKNLSSPGPAVLNVIGHFKEGKAADVMQRLSIAQVRNGFVAFTIDCMGQGERQIYDAGASGAHGIIGMQAFISGTHVFNLMVWDAIRAIDYLVTRPEVDPEKIGITGHSGGGMMSTYILPFEPRITVAVPTCNPNTWLNRVHANLGSDHEQVFFGAFASAIDPRGDPLFTHVPKPLLINATTRDPLNPPQGVWALSNWLFKSYSAHGVPEKFATTMIEAGHDYNQEQREVTNAWMLRWTQSGVEEFWEEDIAIEEEQDLWAARMGSVYNEPASRHPHAWVQDYLTEHKATWPSVQTEKALKQHKARMATLTKNVLYTNTDDIGVKADFEAPRYVGDITIRPFILQPEERIILPGILLEPKAKQLNKDVILYINENGKSDILKDMDVINDVIKEGYTICAIDLRGFGETAPDLSNKFWDFLAGKPIFGQRVRDVLATIQWLKESDIKAKNIKYWGTGMGALYGAFAGVLTDDISEFVLEDPLLSFENVVHTEIPRYGHEIILPGILKKFDMPQVYQALSPRPLTLINPKSGDKTTSDKSNIEIMEKSVLPAYKATGKQQGWRLQILSEEEREITIGKLLQHR